jgi:elongation factor Ts
MAVAISAIKELRDMTGAGMGDCKKALEASGGDMEGAIDFLRKLGQKLSVKRADREAKEGVVIALNSHNRNKGIVLKLSCETDFVAKTDRFIDLAKSFAEIALQKTPATLEALLALAYDADLTIMQKIQEQTGVMGEKVELASYASIVTAAGQGQVIPYIHAGYRAGVLVALNLEGTDLIEAGKNVAMQVAAMKPVALDKEGVSAEIIAREIEIGKEQARADGKPEAMIEKIAMGKLNAFYKESTLLNQVYVKDKAFTVATYLQSAKKGLTATAFKHIALG